MIVKGVVTDISGNRIKVMINQLDNSVSDWINIIPQKCTLKIGDVIHTDCEYTPEYNINDNVAVEFKNSLKGIVIIGKCGD